MKSSKNITESTDAEKVPHLGSISRIVLKTHKNSKPLWFICLHWITPSLSSNSGCRGGVRARPSSTSFRSSSSPSCSTSPRYNSQHWLQWHQLQWQSPSVTVFHPKRASHTEKHRILWRSATVTLLPITTSVTVTEVLCTACGHRMANRKWKKLSNSQACCLAQLSLAAA